MSRHFVTVASMLVVGGCQFRDSHVHLVTITARTTGGADAVVERLSLWPSPEFDAPCHYFPPPAWPLVADAYTDVLRRLGANIGYPGDVPAAYRWLPPLSTAPSLSLDSDRVDLEPEAAFLDLYPSGALVSYAAHADLLSIDEQDIIVLPEPLPPTTVERVGANVLVDWGGTPGTYGDTVVLSTALGPDGWARCEVPDTGSAFFPIPPELFGLAFLSGTTVTVERVSSRWNGHPVDDGMVSVWAQGRSGMAVVVR